MLTLFVKHLRTGMIFPLNDDTRGHKEMVPASAEEAIKAGYKLSPVAGVAEGAKKRRGRPSRTTVLMPGGVVINNHYADDVGIFEESASSPSTPDGDNDGDDDGNGDGSTEDDDAEADEEAETLNEKQVINLCSEIMNGTGPARRA